MKNIYIVFLFIAFESASQDFARQASWIPEKSSAGDNQIEVIIKKNNAYLEGSIADIPTLVYSSFTTVYKGAENISCFIDANHTSLTFLFNNETTIIKYKNDGSIFSIRKTYAADKVDPSLASYLAQQIHSNFQVKFITELQQEGIRSFNINLSNGKEWMNLKLVTDKNSGELQVVGRQVSTTNYR